MAPNFIKIDSVDDPRIAAYRNLKDRDLRSLSGEDAHHGRFVLEGLTVIEKALAGSLYPICLSLIAQNRKDRLAALAASITISRAHLCRRGSGDGCHSRLPDASRRAGHRHPAPGQAPTIDRSNIAT
jgi:hypothetical protein